FLLNEAGASPEVAAGVEQGLYKGTLYHLGLAQELANVEQTNAPDLWKEFNERGELWRTVASLGEQLQIARMINTDPTRVDLLADKIFENAGEFHRQAFEAVKNLVGKPDRMEDALVELYCKAIEANQVLAALYAQHSEGNYSEGVPKGYVTMLVHGGLRPLLYAHGKQFLNSGPGQILTSGLIELTPGFEMPEHLAELAYHSLSPAEVERVNTVLNFAGRCHAANPLVVSQHVAPVGPPIVASLQTVPPLQMALPQREVGRSEVTHTTLEEPLARFGTKYGEIYGAIPLRDRLLVHSEQGIVECSPNPYCDQEGLALGRIVAFGPEERFYPQHVGKTSNSLSSTGQHIFGLRTSASLSGDHLGEVAEIKPTEGWNHTFSVRAYDRDPYDLYPTGDVSWNGDDTIVALAEAVAPRVM
ncbi:MAG: hypothetical protein KDD60_12305, partial [Bdellovibrionales bacterium]|nr:hypothetical protein [Bdellovibrionales bacterium]